MNIVRSANIALVASIIALSLPHRSEAAPSVRFSVVATVENIYDPIGILGGSIQLGDPLKGLIQYETNLPDMDPDPSRGLYDGDPISRNFMIGSDSSSGFFSTEFFFDVSIADESPGNGADSIEFFASGDTTPSTLILTGVDYVDLQVNLTDLDGTAFNADVLPTQLDLADFEVATVTLSAENFLQEFQYSVDARITSITTTAIPEPQSASALVMVLAGLGWRRWRSRR
ncbi:hypothetical protein K227x_56710 [Rubripirellula lacrimiformis]|uniref:PEP-CTERM protein-sorting domain-containing protein n=1 Tax=Rubripirellula lacrimiformis TaxID=1930273 RepID=A0A517NJF8_9BACT|nr:hypothetical protein [Rubripirellula lacrimiformis]QDT07245.1 hypothetical protein K227x_56710 [Rubripirellula lacrimiformis]